MLPGGILMVTGGYSISSSRAQRRDSLNVNTQTYFLNTTSNAWIADYTPLAKPTTPASEEKGLLSTTGQKAGLGVGIGVGLAVVCGLVAFCIWHRRRAQRRRDLREKQLQDLSYMAHRYNPEEYATAFDDRNGRLDTSDYLVDQNGPYVFPPGTQGGQGWKATNGGDAERTGLLVEIPSPTRGLRRSLSGRPGYAVARSQVPSGIHPIDELEEEPEDEQAHMSSPSSSRHPEMTELRSKLMATMLNTEASDASADAQRLDNGQRNTLHATHESPGHSRTHSLGRLQLNSAGRLSPEKFGSERTSSNLSERSDISWASSHDGVGGASMRPGNILNNIPGSSRSPDASLSSNKTSRNGDVGRHSPDEPRTNSLNSVESNGQPDLESFQTARSSFAHLQAEGEALLGGNPDRPRPGTGSSRSDAYRDTEGSNSRAATATPATSCALEISTAPQPTPKVRRISWLGSVRRVLTRSVSSAERTRSMHTPIIYHEPYRDDPTSPVEPRPIDTRKSFPAATAPPQRAASDASFWRNRRGKKDWLDDEEDSAWRRAPGDDWGTPEDIALAERERQRQEWRERGNLLVNISNDDHLPTPRSLITPDHLGVPTSDDRPCTPASEADWDVEAAVERRVVQVMFTVPKSKLRVVNADVEGSSIMSMSRDGDDHAAESSSSNGTTNRVKDLAGRFEQMNSSTSSLRFSPRPSPSNSIKSMKVRSKRSGASLARQQSVRSAAKERGLKPLNREEGDGD
ncbi:uncharacterized protein SETTUDRAFT_114640 [Exserohilum turcica Et28A]|uniref:Uncharacterized protein n=1 Tax=Exserohilum turcicum (strain 28A) TaxID=671987 RepID=R0J5T5_EXST2|nr:uncharacterized protein SETTUDRAFT_114640 [Exserohilum turcica Et28A]EOA92270.1 hypothetical protein SETTUDRAFT_114640 [Exserohilum turcica Et28A]